MQVWHICIHINSDCICLFSRADLAVSVTLVASIKTGHVENVAWIYFRDLPDSVF